MSQPRYIEEKRINSVFNTGKILFSEFCLDKSIINAQISQQDQQLQIFQIKSLKNHSKYVDIIQNFEPKIPKDQNIENFILFHINYQNLAIVIADYQLDLYHFEINQDFESNQQNHNLTQSLKLNYSYKDLKQRSNQIYLLTTNNKIHIQSFDINTTKLSMMKTINTSIKNFAKFQLHAHIQNQIVSWGQDISLSILDIGQTSEGEVLKLSNKLGKLDWHQSPIHTVLYLDQNKMVTIDDNGTVQQQGDNPDDYSDYKLVGNMGFNRYVRVFKENIIGKMGQYLIVFTFSGIKMFKVGTKMELIFEETFIDEIAIVNQVDGLAFDVIDNSQNQRAIKLVWDKKEKKKAHLVQTDVIPLNTEDVSNIWHVYYKENNLYFIETSSIYLKIFHLESNKFYTFKVSDSDIASIQVVQNEDKLLILSCNKSQTNTLYSITIKTITVDTNEDEEHLNTNLELIFEEITSFQSKNQVFQNACFICKKHKFILTSGRKDSINIHEQSLKEKSVTMNIQNMKDHKSDITCITMNKKEKLLLAGSLDKNVQVYEIKTTASMFELKFVLSGHKRHIQTVRIVNDKVFSAGAEGKIRVWDLNDGTCVKVINDKVTEGQDEAKIVTGSKNKDKKSKDKIGGKEKDTKNEGEEGDEDEDEAYQTPIQDIMMLNNTYLLSCGGKIRVWDQHSGASQDTVHKGDKVLTAQPSIRPNEPQDDRVQISWPKYFIVGGKSSYLTIYKDTYSDQVQEQNKKAEFEKNKKLEVNIMLRAGENEKALKAVVESGSFNLFRDISIHFNKKEIDLSGFNYKDIFNTSSINFIDLLKKMVFYKEQRHLVFNYFKNIIKPTNIRELQTQLKGQSINIKQIGLKLKEHLEKYRQNVQASKSMLLMAEQNVDIQTNLHQEIKDITYRNKNITLEFEMNDE